MTRAIDIAFWFVVVLVGLNIVGFTVAITIVSFIEWREKRRA